MHSGPFGCLTKLGAKRAELLQKFVPRGRIGIICNERTRSTPLDPKLTFWCVSYYLGAFKTIWLPYKTQYKTGQKFVPRSHVGFFRNEHTRSTPLDPKLKFWCVLFYLGALSRLVALRNSVQNRPNKCKSSCHKVVSEFFRNKRTRTTPLDPELMF